LAQEPEGQVDRARCPPIGNHLLHERRNVPLGHQIETLRSERTDRRLQPDAVALNGLGADCVAP